MQEILKSYLRRLTNLSGSNRSILLLKLLSEQFIDIHEFDYALNQPSFDIMKGLMARKTKIPLCSVQDSRDKDSNKLSTRLKKLKRVDHLVFEEQGARDLYVGWPFVKGKFNDGTVVRCPLMFFPVTLESDEKQWYVSFRKDVNITLNKSFVLAYAFYNGLSLDEGLLERVFDDFDRESTGFRTDLFELLKAHNMEVHFNQDNFQDVLKRFESYKKPDLDLLEKEGELKLFPEAVLGIFPQAGSYLVPDYMTLIEEDKYASMEDFFLERNLDENDNEKDSSSYYRFLKRVKEDQTFTPFKMDAYQENAIKAIKKGNSAVVQGPPGTGKSQMICNLVADYIARGKNVLVVSQKRAALDVVFGRLKEKQLNDFIGLLHDFKNDRKPIYEQLEGQVNRLTDYMAMNNSLDALQIERNFLKTSRRIDQLEEELEEFKDALFDESECGLSVKELYLTSSPHEPFFALNQEYRGFHFDEVDGFLKKIQTYSQYASRFLNENYTWYKRKSFALLTMSDLQNMVKHLDEMYDYIHVLETVTEKAVGKKLKFEDAVEIIDKRDDITHLSELLQEPDVYNGVLKLNKISIRPVTKQEVVEVEKIVLQFFKGRGPELSLHSSELGRFQEVLERGISARENIFRWFTWKFFSKDKIFITRVLVANQLRNNKEDFSTLVTMVDNRLNLEHNMSRFKNGDGLNRLPDIYNRINVQNWFFFQKQSIEARDILNEIRPLRDYISLETHTEEIYTEKLKKLVTSLEPIGEKLKNWLIYFSIPQMREIFSRQMETGVLLSTLRKDFDSLCEFDQLSDNLNNEEKNIIEKLKDHSSKIDAEVWQRDFMNSLKLAWIDHLELKYPILRAVSSNKLEDLQSELQECVREKLRISNEILLIKARERVYKSVEYNRLNNLVTYRDLFHQVTKKRRIWPVRKLMSNFPREIFDLMPCWLASPESVSAIFPMEKMFDLVIFDEASQCFVEKGLPAMYRGKQVVIAGDDKQLKPNDLYQVRWEEENEDDLPELDFDSLLNLANQHIMQVQLNGHYRSKNIDLIRFSNEHFYGNRLKMLPDFEEVNQHKAAIEYLKVEGVWEKNDNQVEAQEVSRLVKRLLDQRPELEIGIVTFNSRQQMFIIEHLEQYAIDHNFLIPETLIVKNIENIQGDEKDVIIFSTVYAPDSSGKLNMHFGSLNADGGENRLNVAITRAREKIYLISSIHPQQLRVDDSKNEGPKLLKKYLEFAHKISEGQDIKYDSQELGHSSGWYLKSKIEKLGYEKFEDIRLVESFPNIDLTIKEGKDYAGAVLTDDDYYHQSVSVKDAHVYRDFTLRQKNWPYTRVYSRQLWADPEHVKERLNRLIFRNLKEES
ncbi:AAA domain-containing protein [Reichenbachiella agarivorans]|uniref:AAA domain-containing protein n=1 Tax=Reichenbachiella agarivorans TaxID=2979464 RepID=A0ABY6CRV2_9BACT|nr:AAA domain-containing protein [Reichenbachiella agarivorans]UXP33213.1 AAA domain-containing protein [Reichenbachiella agarivorans]